MPLSKPTTAPSRFITFITFVLVVAVLRVAHEVMIPLALALLLSFLLSPLVVRLRHWRFPKPVAIAITVTIAFAVIGAASWTITSQSLALLKDLPSYEENLQNKIAALKRPEASGSLSRTFVSLERMWQNLLAAAPELAPKHADRRTPTPVPVEVKAVASSPLDLAQQIAVTLGRPLATAGIVVVFVIVILFQREDLRSRFIRVISGGKLNIATEAVDDAAQRVSRYLAAQLVVNTVFGLCIGTGLYFIGTPHAPLWGLLATLLRFIPFLGPILAVILPLVLAVAVDPGWSMVGWTLALFAAAELITNNVIEVLVYGTSTGISALALITAAVFWSWVWGPVGLLLSTPLTVCLLVIGQYVPGLKFLSVLIGSEPALDPAAEFYQRMLAMDQEEMFASADAYVEERSLAAFYDEVFVPALLLSEIDRHNGVLAEVRQKFILESGRELIDELGQRPVKRSGAEETGSSGDNAQTDNRPLARPTMIVGVPAHDEADELIAHMLVQLLRENGCPGRVESIAHSSHDETSSHREEIVFISALPPSTLGSASRACRHIKHRNPRTKVVIGIWNGEGPIENLRRRLMPAGADAIAVRLAEAVVQLKELALGETSSPGTLPPASAKRSASTIDKRAEVKAEDVMEITLREAAQTCGVPVALVSIVETDRHFWRPYANSAEEPAATQAVVPNGDDLVSETALAVSDIAKEARYASNAALTKRGVQSFATVPLRTRGGHLVGNLCVVDTRPRDFGDRELTRLQELGAELMASLDRPEAVAAQAD
jgi:predicted PurR-regulated permease PerM